MKVAQYFVVDRDFLEELEGVQYNTKSKAFKAVEEGHGEVVLKVLKEPVVKAPDEAA